MDRKKGGKNRREWSVKERKKEEEGGPG